MTDQLKWNIIGLIDPVYIPVYEVIINRVSIGICLHEMTGYILSCHSHGLVACAINSHDEFSSDTRHETQCLLK